MTVQEVMLKALSGEMHWFRAADILGWSPRTLRRWRERYETHGYVGLIDKRRHSPSVRRIAAPEVERLLRLYRERYRGFNVRHFHQIARREHGVTVSYSFLKYTLQAAGLVKKHRARGRHRRRRSLGPALASCCTSTAVRMPGWRCGPTIARCSSPWWMTPPRACSLRSCGPARRPSRS